MTFGLNSDPKNYTAVEQYRELVAGMTTHLKTDMTGSYCIHMDLKVHLAQIVPSSKFIGTHQQQCRQSYISIYGSTSNAASDVVS